MIEQIIQTLTTNVLDLFIYSYTASTLLATYFILNDFIKNPKDTTIRIVTISVGLILGLIWFYIVDEKEIDKLIYSFFFANALYSLIIKVILKAIKKKYNNNKGLV